MPDTRSDLAKPIFVILALIIAWIVRDAWFQRGAPEPPRTINLSQQWSLQPGDTIANFKIASSLGDISVAVGGKTVRAPFDGTVQLNKAGCILYSTQQVPAYLFRLCGIHNPRLGKLRQGDVIGTADYLQFATLRKQPDGKWAFVETSKDILEKILKQP